MTEIVFKHLRQTSNIGDRSCCPSDYFNYRDSMTLDLGQPTPACNSVVYGGGKIFGSLRRSFSANDWKAKHRIAWGVSTVQSNPFSLRYYLSRNSMNLVGSRDYGDLRYDFAPCVSCMSPVFDESIQAAHDVVVYMHREKSEPMKLRVPSHIPVRDNFAASMEEAVRFLGSGRTIVSNSYHGVYWGLLLGRKVLCLPFSHKFNYYRLLPGYATAENWLSSLNSAQAHGEMLDLCRDATAEFRRKVDAMIMVK